MTMMLFRASRRGIPSQFSRWLSAQAQPQPNIPVQHTGIFINNEWRTSSIKKTFPVINPSTGKTVVEVQQAGQNDVEAAVYAAENAFKVDSPWRQMDASARGLLLNRLADLMERDADILASLESLDNGKPFADSSQVDIPSSIKVIRYFAGWTDKMHGLTIPIDGPYVCYTRREPVGVCAQIIPWNFPLLMMSWKIGPALSMGNVVILKPAEQTPLTALYTANLIKEAGFPPGVLNVLPGFGDTGAALTVHNRINKVAFTGSTEVGKLIQEGAAKSNLKRVTLELGGKSPNVIFPDVNVDFAVQQAHLGIFFNMGQVCCAGSRTFVHSKIYDEFVEKSAKLAQNRRVGNPFEANTEQGPQIDQDQVGKIEELVESGKKEGAQLVAGGCALKDREGYFFQPTVFANVKDDMRIAKEEIFGPVQQLLKFEDDDEIIARANNTTYGLASAVYTNDLKRAANFIEKVQAGTVWVNCYNVFGAQAPFGGFKMSGQGRELGSAGLEQYTELKTVIINAK